MLKKITQSAADLIELLGIEGTILLKLLGRSAGLAALMLAAALVAGIGLLGLAAAAVVALAQTPMGTAGALTLVSGVILIVAASVIFGAWSMMSHARTRAKLAMHEERLQQKRRELMERLNEPEPPPSPLMAAVEKLHLNRLDPVMVAAAVGAVAVLVGPKRLIKGTVAAAKNVTLVASLIAAGKSAVDQVRLHNGRLG